MRIRRREENPLYATVCFIALIICATSFGHLYARHQELESILMLLPHVVCNALVAGGLLLGAQLQAYSACQTANFTFFLSAVC